MSTTRTAAAFIGASFEIGFEIGEEISRGQWSAPQETESTLTMKIVQRAVGPMTDHQRQVIWVVIGTADAAIQHWMAGILTPGEVRFQILSACSLLDLPADQIAADRRLADQEPT
ncbi:hypothetical protein [Nonomuraea sp. NPDC049028]|uniref:hypothetical protein n=1 Tax=Nonomuraea sp. NPDC049028 TaxID=3364348 RepID=UPI00371F099C